MKIFSIVTTLLAAATPFVSAANGGLRKLEPAPSGYRGPAGKWCSDNPGASACGGNGNANGRQDTTPTLDQLNEIYGTFCEICNFVDDFSIDLLLGTDAGLCVLVCDLIPEIPDPNDIAASSCFSEISTVQVENLGRVTMKDLQLGARVLTQSGNYEPVYAFGHKNPTKSSEFLQFQTAETSLEVTGGHLVFLEGKTNPVRADSINVGDVLQGNNAQINKINTVQRDGLYSPLTPSGTVVVDGIAASTYISLQKGAAEFVEFQGGLSTFISFQDGIHMAMSPFRMFTMGVSSGLGNAYNEEGIPLYAAYGMDLGKWADSQNILVQLILMLACVSVAGAFMTMENTFGPTMAPIAIAAGAGAYMLMKKSGIRVRAQKVKSA